MFSLARRGPVDLHSSTSTQPTSLRAHRLNESPSIPISALHPAFSIFLCKKAPALANLSITACPVVALTGGPQRWARHLRRLAARRSLMINQAGSESKCWQQRHTDSWFGRQWARSRYLTCQGSQSIFCINPCVHIRKDARRRSLFATFLNAEGKKKDLLTGGYCYSRAISVGRMRKPHGFL